MGNGEGLKVVKGAKLRVGKRGKGLRMGKGEGLRRGYRWGKKGKA
jgi:hypothetical protein